MRLTSGILKKLILEAMEDKTLPDEVYITIDYSKTGWGDIEIYFSNSEGNKLPKESKIWGELEYATETEEECLGAYELEWVSAKQGWGPYLIDIAIEVSTLSAGGLITDRDEVSDEAFSVFDTYNKKRPDVKKDQLDWDGFLTSDPKDDCDQIETDAHLRRGEDWWDNPLAKSYSKDPIILRKIRSKIINRVKEISF